jgi:hypothetical protein
MRNESLLHNKSYADGHLLFEFCKNKPDAVL